MNLSEIRLYLYVIVRNATKPEVIFKNYCAGLRQILKEQCNEFTI